jgi:YVTN family beta-propeller protein
MKDINRSRLALLLKMLILVSVSITIVNRLSTVGLANEIEGRKSNTVSSTPALQVVKKIKVGSQPTAITVSFDSQFVYVANWNSETISVIDAKRKTVVSTIYLGFHPSSVVVTSEQILYVADYDDGLVFVIEPSNYWLITVVSVGNSPVWLTLSPPYDANTWPYYFIYVANSGDGTVSVIDSNTNGILGSPIPVGGVPTELLASPSGKSVYLYGGYAPANDLVLIDVASQTFTHVGDPQIVENALSISPDGSTLYGIDLGSNSIVMLDCASEEVVGTIPGPKNFTLNTTAISPDGKFLYVAAANDLKNEGEMLVVDTSTNQFVGTPTRFSSGSTNAMAMAPHGNTLYTTNNGTVSVVAISGG